MTKEQVIVAIGKERWGEFEHFMRGQTIGINEDGSEEYYDGDVNNFLEGGKIYD